MEPSDQARVESLLYRLGELNGRIAALRAMKLAEAVHLRFAIDELYALTQKEIKYYDQQNNQGNNRTARPFVGL